MTYNSEHLKRARDISDILISENISSDLNNPPINIVRNLAMEMSSEMPGPGLTANVATTLAGVGLCQELSQRFILEYCLKFSEQNIGLVFLDDQGKGNHAFVYIGDVNVPDDLYIGRGNSEIKLSESENYSLQDFIKANPSLIFVDPLEKFVGTADDLSPILNYCNSHDITHVKGIRDYSKMAGLVENASTVKENAEKIAADIAVILKKSGPKAMNSASQAGIFGSVYATTKQPYGPYSDHYCFPPDDKLKPR